MPWDRSAPTNPKYRSKQHRDYRARLVRQLERDGYLVCTAEVCVFESRLITTANGRARAGLHAGHSDDGVNYAGPQHNACNVRDGSVRARGRQGGKPTRWII